MTGIKDGFPAVFQQSGMMFKNGRYTFLKKEDIFHIFFFIYANGSAPEEGVLMRDNDSVTFHWLPIAELDGVEIYPTFLKTELPNLSDYPKHFIRRD